LSILASSCARTTTRRARSVNLSNMSSLSSQRDPAGFGVPACSAW
jgi:hypothetical protein